MPAIATPSSSDDGSRPARPPPPPLCGRRSRRIRAELVVARTVGGSPTTDRADTGGFPLAGIIKADPGPIMAGSDAGTGEDGVSGADMTSPGADNTLG